MVVSPEDFEATAVVPAMDFSGILLVITWERLLVYHAIP
jgi:hypothetical protein